MTSTTFDLLAENAVAQTQKSLDSVSKEVVFVNEHFLDGPFDKQLLLQRCREHAHGIAQRYLLLGRDLLVLKANCDHGEFVPMLEEIGINARQAQSFMRVAVKYNKPELLALGERLKISKLIALADEDDEDLEGLLESGQLNGHSLDAIERMSVRELKAALRKSQQALIDQKEVHDKIITDKNKHADGLTTTLMQLQNAPVVEDWPEHVNETVALLMEASLNAQQALLSVLSVMDARHNLEMPGNSQHSVCTAYINEANTLSHLVGQLQDFINRAFPQFVDRPVFVMAEALTPVSGG